MKPFHAKTFQLLRVEPRINEAAVAQIEAVEARLGFCLPASVREWYIYENAIEILEKHSNADPPIPLHQFAIQEWQSQRLLPFRVENQGVCIWSILLDSSDDPPVYIDLNCDGKSWEPLATAFSEYVYTCVWDYVKVLHQSAGVQAQNAPLSTKSIEVLQQIFTAEPKTFGWPGSVQYRFAGQDGYLLIWSADGQADWWIGASTESSLEKMLTHIWDLDAVGKHLWEFTDAGRAVLAKIRQTKRSG